MDDDGELYTGCNIELAFRHGMHAEVSALGNMAVSNPDAKAAIIVIAAERELFMPCGECLDWVFALGSKDTWVVHESAPGKHVQALQAGRLMPWYPK